LVFKLTIDPLGSKGVRSMNAGSIDTHIGSRLRARRKQLGLSVADLAAKSGIAEKELQRMELGQSRIDAALLYTMSKILDVPVGYFFDGLQ
jgi:transcriptional regulator with XRE-family HTH domain